MSLDDIKTGDRVTMFWYGGVREFLSVRNVSTRKSRNRYDDRTEIPYIITLEDGSKWRAGDGRRVGDGPFTSVYIAPFEEEHTKRLERQQATQKVYEAKVDEVPTDILRAVCEKIVSQLDPMELYPYLIKKYIPRGGIASDEMMEVFQPLLEFFERIEKADKNEEPGSSQLTNS